jgi:hypothetical protein
MRVLTCVTALLLAASPAQANDSVKAKLEQLKIKYEVDKDGDYKVIYTFTKEKRTQLLYVSGRTETLDSMQIREILSPAARLSEDNITADRAMEFLRHSASRKIGSWELRGSTIYMVIKIPDTVSSADLETFMDVAASSADEMEKSISGDKDEL